MALEAILKENVRAHKFTNVADAELGAGKNFGALFAFSSLSKYLRLSEFMGESRAGRLALMMAVLRPIKSLR